MRSLASGGDSTGQSITMTPLGRGLLLVIALTFNAVVGWAATPREAFEGDGILAAAVGEIGALNREQLQAVIDYLASCGPTPAPERDFHCERASTTLQIKTSRALALAQVRSALYVVDKLIPWKGSGTTDENAKRIDRRVEIFHTLTRAAAERYQTLNTGEGRK